ncbi:MAG TPA: type 4a pilus biogenesis protein PilO [Vicinamibacterales bacterium]|nr:type 4a pilus biogenesis protein PilO [Vicinamibacterales bacterium]
MTPVRRIVAEKRRLVYPLIAAVILNVALFAAVVYPLSQKVEGGERAADDAAAALAAARRDHTAARQTVTGKVSADDELKKFYGAVLPPDLSAARRVTLGGLADLARQAGVKHERTQWNQEVARDGRLGKLTATVTLSGQYRDIRRLIHDIETAPEFLILENLALTQRPDRDTGLNVTIDVSTYYRIEGNEF